MVLSPLTYLSLGSFFLKTGNLSGPSWYLPLLLFCILHSCYPCLIVVDWHRPVVVFLPPPLHTHTPSPPHTIQREEGIQREEESIRKPSTSSTDRIPYFELTADIEGCPCSSLQNARGQCIWFRLVPLLWISRNSQNFCCTKISLHQLLPDPNGLAALIILCWVDFLRVPKVYFAGISNRGITLCLKLLEFAVGCSLLVFAQSFSLAPSSTLSLLYPVSET